MKRKMMKATMTKRRERKRLTKKKIQEIGRQFRCC
jgi:hypothetical protein